MAGPGGVLACGGKLVEIDRKCRGAGKNKSTDPPPLPVHLLNPRPTHPPADFFFLIFLSTFLGRFWARGVHKHHKIFDKNFDVSVSSTFLVIAFSVVSQRREFKNTTKKVVQKNRQKI
jgi:hypothetical protein